MFSNLSPKIWWGGKHPKSVQYRDEEYATGKPVYVPNAVRVVSGEVSYDVHGNVVSDTRKYETFDKAVDWQSWCQNYPYRAIVTDGMDKLFANTFSRTYLKIRHISLSYDFHRFLPSTSAIKGLAATLFCNNPVLWAKAPYVDPDVSGDGSHDNGATDPTARYVGLGFNIKF